MMFVAARSNQIFSYLSVVNLLFERVVCDEPVDVADLGLSVSVDPAHGLAVVARVPRSVEDNDSVGADQIDAQTLQNKIGI